MNRKNIILVRTFTLLIITIVIVIYLRKKIQILLNEKIMKNFTNYYGASNNLDENSGPRGIRNNNPGNLKISSSNWLGKMPEDERIENFNETVFETFYSFDYGYRAMLKLIQNYYKQGYTTLRQIINRYAPKSENDSGAYINFVSNKTGISPDEDLQLPNKETLFIVTKYMVWMENGGDYITREHFNRAYELI